MKHQEFDALTAGRLRVAQLENQGFSRLDSFIIMVKERRKAGKIQPFSSYEAFKRHLTYYNTGR